MVGNATKSPPLGQFRAGAKLILLGEHFVVHGAPAVALPLGEVGTTVTVRMGQAGQGGPRLVTRVPSGEARTMAGELLHLACQRLELARAAGSWVVEVAATMPMGQGLGSSASFCAALCGALARAGGRELSDRALRGHAHALERRVHGQPSGIDDTVVTMRRPVWFVRGAEPEFLQVPRGLALVLGSTGTPGSTREAVAGVRALMARDPGRFGALLGEAVELAGEGRADLEAGELGEVASRFHELLVCLGVSTPALDALVCAALDAGALGAKLTGSGGGGFVLALVTPERMQSVAGAMKAAGASPVIQSGR